MRTEEQNEEIYKKIFAKGFENGFIPFSGLEKGFSWTFNHGNIWIRTEVWDFEQNKAVEHLNACNMEKILFDHTFAKCLWGEDLNFVKLNLAEMAMSEDRTDFLSHFIETELSTPKEEVDSSINKVV